MTFEDLNRMYNLLSRIDEGIKPMLEVLQDFITNTGFDAVKSIPEKETKVTSMGATFLFHRTQRDMWRLC
jgi:hypothetical protein